jgi:hypothetical protein
MAYGLARLARLARYAIATGTVAVLWLGLLTLTASAHLRYDYRCCGEQDCAPVASSAVHETGDVIIFRIAPGSHPMWPADKPAHLIVEIDRFRLEQRRLDGQWHICLNPALIVLCAYPPDLGS